MNQEVCARVYERFNGRGYIGFCLGVPGAVYVHGDPDKCLNMCVEVYKALQSEKEKLN